MNEIIYDNGIIFITLNNPPENYLTKPEFIKLEKLKQLVDRRDTKGLIINGTGRHFSAGAELPAIQELVKKGDLKQELEKGKALLKYIQNVDIPSIAVIEGVCFGGGLEIALSCLIRVASEKALFAFPEVTHDLLPGMGGTQLIRFFLSAGQSAEMILTGDITNCETARELKIIDYQTPSKKAAEFALNLMQKMTNNREPEVIRAIVKSIKHAGFLSYEEALQKETELFCELAKKATF